jgi:hypothetical protein
MADAFKVATMSPLTAIFDGRTSVDLLPAGIFSWKQNWEISADGKLRQAHGFARPYQFNITHLVDGVPTPCDYKNWDFHDQGAGFNGVDIDKREPITFLFASTQNDGTRRLFAGTKTRFMLLNELTGVWATLKNGYGNDGTETMTQIRFNGDELQNKVFITNGFDNVQYYDLVSTTIGDVPNLATAGENGGAITKVNRIVSWQGVIFIMNFVEEGTRLASRIRWSDLNNGLDWGQDPASISDFQDLDYGEEILNAIPLLGSLYIFTNKSIWRCNFSVDTAGGSASLNCVKVYTEPKNQSKCLAFENMIVSTGFSIFYGARDAIYEYNPYLVEPDRTDWIYPASSLIYSAGATQLDFNSCASPIAEYWPDTKEIHFSWPVVEVIQIAGSTDCNAPTGAVNSGLNRHTLVCNTQYKSCDYRDYGSTALVNFRQDVSGQASCNQSPVFLGANTDDFCLKQFGLGYAREFYDAASDSFSMKGFSPILRGVFPFGQFDKDKKVKSFLINALPEANLTTVFRLRIGMSRTALDPNQKTAGCGVVWHQLSNKTVKCLEDMTPEDYANKNIAPTGEMLWTFLYRGIFLFYEITIANADNSPATSGGVSISRFEVKALALNAP